MIVVHFTSSDSFMESDPRACEHELLEVIEYVECTYNELRTGPDGTGIAWFLNDAWQLLDGSRFSDWAVRLS